MRTTLLAYNNAYSGMIVRARYLYAIRDDLRGGVSADDGSGVEHTVVLSGFYSSGKQTWLQTISGDWVIAEEIVSTVGRATEATATPSAVQSMIKRLIDCNKRIYENNLICARFAQKLTTEQRDDLRGLQLRLVNRDTALRECTGLTDKAENYPAGYINETQYLQAITSDVATIGLVVTTSAMIVVSAVVVASMAVAVYFAFKWYLSEAEKDVKFSDKLTATLTSKLTAEEYEQLRKETAGIVTKARLSEKLNAGGNIIKWLVIAVGGGMIYKAYKDGKLNFKTKKR